MILVCVLSHDIILTLRGFTKFRMKVMRKKKLVERKTWKIYAHFLGVSTDFEIFEKIRKIFL